MRGTSSYGSDSLNTRTELMGTSDSNCRNLNKDSPGDNHESEIVLGGVISYRICYLVLLFVTVRRRNKRQEINGIARRERTTLVSARLERHVPQRVCWVLLLYQSLFPVYTYVHIL